MYLQQYADPFHGQLHQGWRLGESLDLNDVVFVQRIQGLLSCLQCRQHLVQFLLSFIYSN